MNKLFKKFIFGLVWITLIWGCVFDPNDKANELFVQASMLMQNAESETLSYLKSYNYYIEAKNKIEAIILKYPSSNIAVDLISGKTKILGYKLDELKGLDPVLKKLSNAEENLYLCALLLSYKRRENLFVLNKAIECSKNGDKEESTRLFSETIKTVIELKEWSPTNSVLVQKAVEYAKVGQFIDALATAEKITEKDKVIALARIASEYAKAGDKDKAMQLFSHALTMVNTLPSNYIDGMNKYKAVIEIVVQYAKTGQFVEALTTANAITNGHMELEGKYAKGNEKVLLETYRDEALVEIADVYANKGQFNEALTTANTITELMQPKAFAKIAVQYAKVGRFEDASAMATMIKYGPEKDLVIAFIAVEYAKARQFIEALKTTEKVEDRFRQILALSKIVGEYIKAGQNEKSMELLSKMLGSVLKIEDNGEKAMCLTKIAERYSEIGQQPMEQDYAILRSLVHNEFPASDFWINH